MSTIPRRAVSAALASALLGLAPATRPPAPAPSRILLAPPNGTYVYAIARNGTDQGTTTVVLLRRVAEGSLETDEIATVGAARAHIAAAYRLNDFGLDSYVAGYQAPFPRTSPLGAESKVRPRVGFYDQTTVRVHVSPGGATYTIDGVQGERMFPSPPANTRAGRATPQVIFDAPFITGPLLVPAIRHASGSAAIAPFSVAIEEGALGRIEGRVVRAKPLAAKTPRADEALEYPGLATLWYDPHTVVVHEIYFEGLNLDARLVSYSKVTTVPAFEPAQLPTPAAALPDDELSFPSTGDVTLSGTLTAPPNVKAPYPVVVMVAPPWPVPATRNFGGDGPEPMFPSLARTFAQRGYAVLRYDGRGIGKSGGSYLQLNWQQSLDDVEAAIAAVRDDPSVDRNRVYLLGFGYGADLALAAASDSAVKVAGVVALGPSVVPYRAAKEREYLARAKSPGETAAARAQFARFVAHLGKGSDKVVVEGMTVDGNDGTWLKTAFEHDPTVLATRSKTPVFVLHSGVTSAASSVDDVHSYDDRLREANPFSTVIVANDLSARFGGRYDADSPLDTEAIFPYRFDPSTAGAIVDWLGAPKVAAPANGADSFRGTSNAPPPRPPPPPPPQSGPAEGFPGRFTPAPKPSEPVLPGQLVVPNAPTPSAEPSPSEPQSPAPTPS